MVAQKDDGHKISVVNDRSAQPEVWVARGPRLGHEATRSEMHSDSSKVSASLYAFTCVDAGV